MYTMWHSYILRKCCKFWHSTPLSCQKRCSKKQKIWHQNEALYGQQIASHISYGLDVGHKCTKSKGWLARMPVSKETLKLCGELDTNAENATKFVLEVIWKIIWWRSSQDPGEQDWEEEEMEASSCTWLSSHTTGLQSSATTTLVHFKLDKNVVPENLYSWHIDLFY